jgi:hypothetical protein
MALLGICKPSGLPAWSREAAIGDYGGSLDKRGSRTEGTTPYSYAVYQNLQSQRGSAYSQNQSGTLVHVEHLALARTLSAVFFRNAEKYRANAVPHTSDERLEYWATVLGVPFTESTPRWRLRETCAAHYQAALGPTLDNVTAALEKLLGDAFVQVITTTGVDLDNPPDPTKWPGIDPGPASYSLGGGAWFSARCHLIVEMQQPTGMSAAEFLNLRDIQMFQLLDRMLPAWATFNGAFVGDGFSLDIDQLDFQGLT